MTGWQRILRSALGPERTDHNSRVVNSKISQNARSISHEEAHYCRWPFAMSDYCDDMMVQVAAQYPKTVAPLKNDGVKVLSGEYRGALCTLIAVDDYDGIVKLRGENTYKVLTISVLDKYLDDRGDGQL